MVSIIPTRAVLAGNTDRIRLASIPTTQPMNSSHGWDGAKLGQQLGAGKADFSKFAGSAATWYANQIGARI